MKKWYLISIIALASITVALPTTGSALAKPSKKTTCISLYEHINYKGKKITLCDDAEKLSKFKFNDKASSAKVSKSGNGVTLYEHVNFKGKWIDLKPGAKISNFTKIKGLNDDISSVNIKN